MEMTEQEIFQAMGLEGMESGVENAPEQVGGGESESIVSPEQEGLSGPEQEEPGRESGLRQAENQSDEREQRLAREREESGLRQEQNRRGELEQRLARERAEQQSRDNAYRAAFEGKLNPYTGRPILSQADYQDYERARAEEQRRLNEQRLNESGLTPELLRSVVEDMPVIQQARQVLREAEEARARAEAQQANGWFQEQLKGIAALGLDTDVKTLDDLAGKYPETYGKMMERVSRGNTLVEAYQMVNFDALMSHRTAAARQAAMNSSAGKTHLTPSGQAGATGDMTEVPREVRQMYRDLNPGMSDAEIRRAYGDFLRESK